MTSRKKPEDVGLYDRNKGIPGLPPNWWIRYSITEALRIQFALKTREVREHGGTSKREARAVRAQRMRQVADGGWRPTQERRAGALTFGALAEDVIARRDKAGMKSIRNERQRLRDYVIPHIGHMLVADVRRDHVLAMINHFAERPLEATKKLPAPRMVHRVYEDARVVFAHAREVLQIISDTPCTLRVRRGELPKKKDANPRWRSGARFERDEVELLISDPRIEWPRRMTYALLFLGGMRSGEAVGRKWLDYHPMRSPLGMLVVATQHDDADTKTEETREMPVHPLLAKLLMEWFERGFREFVGRDPQPEDYIVPRIRTRGPNPKTYQDGRRVWVNMQADLKMLGLRRRRVHDTRRTFISMALDDGASEYHLKFVTHGAPKGDAFDEYVTPSWRKLCAEVAKLSVELRSQERPGVLVFKRKSTPDV